MLFTWRFRHAVRRSPGDRVTAYDVDPAIPSERQTPIARLTQTSTTSIPTFS